MTQAADLPTCVWLECDPDSDLEFHQCNSSVEARWLSGEINRQRAMLKDQRIATSREAQP